MKQDKNAPTKKETASKGYLALMLDEKNTRVRNVLHLLFALLPILGIVLTMFQPLCDVRVSGRWHTLIPAQAMQALENQKLGSYAYLPLAAFLVLLVALVIGGILFVRGLFRLLKEEKMIANTKAAVFFGTAVISVFTIFSAIFSPINSMIDANSRTNVSYSALIYILTVLILYSLLAGLIGMFREKDEDKNLFEKRALELRRKQQRSLRGHKVEMLIYTFLNLGVAVVALLSKYVTVSYQSKYMEIPSYTLSGKQLLMHPETLTSKGERIVAFMVFMMMLFCITCFFLTLVSFLSRSMYYQKVALTSVIVGSFTALLVGLLGQYYRIVQNLNVETLQRVIDNFPLNAGMEVGDVLQFSIQSNSIIYFIIEIALLSLIFFRRPYTKIVELEQQLLAESAARIPQTVAFSDRDYDDAAEGSVDVAQLSDAELPTGNDGKDFDPCPAFTEIDRKESEYRNLLEQKQESLFEDPTLPALVDFIVQYARNSHQHLFYTHETIAAFLAGLGTTRLSILQGMSGTGKTSLPRIVAEALMSNCDIVEVESSWRDKNELLGYYNEFNKVYTPKKFTQMLYRAKLNPETVTLIVLDEMNLSRIEYYFSDFLSLMENEPSRRALKLTNVPLARKRDHRWIFYKGLVAGHTLRIPENVWFVGTANRDESTYDISDKVYDRANTINFDKRAARVQYFGEAMEPRFLPVDELMRLFSEAKQRVPFHLEQYSVIGEVEKLLEPYHISFGNRIAKQIEDFVSIYASCFAVTDAVIRDGVEIILLSKVVRKLELKSIEDKEALAAEFDRLNLARCSSFIRSIQED